ncbi:MAG: SDR family oxidoreductase [Actinomyces sp.]|jgi:putative reductase|nr:oxidoreductase, short chain dehydrogenase/reductase family protein [Actinomyces sp. oral taxon 877 str. F0543]RKV64729.1 MAG: SDR family oxidoreductase [Actinomyces sp.]WLD80650.1 SDR family oxidoreductase [Schaalia sp. HMT-877]
MSKRTIVIAGGAHGIGLAVARAAAAQGDEAIIVDRVPPSGTVDARFVRVDLSSARQADEALGSLVKSEDRIDALVVAAGRAANGALGDRPAHEWSEHLSNDVLSVVVPARVLLPALIQTGRDYGVADIVVVGSIAGDTAFKNAVVYGAGSAARNSFGEQLRVELRHENVRVRSIHLGYVRTRAIEAIKPTVLESPFADTPLTPEDVSVVIMHELDQPAHVSTHDIVLVPTRQGWA